MMIRSAFMVPMGSNSRAPGTRRRHRSSSIYRSSRRSASLSPGHWAKPCMCSRPASPLRTAHSINFSHVPRTPKRLRTARCTRRA